MHNLFPLTRQQIESICNHFPGIPEDYLEFLAECGWGDMGMFLCNGSIKANEIYHYEELREEDPPEYEKMEQTWLIGDYGMGDAFGYWIHKGIFHFVDFNHECLNWRSVPKTSSHFWLCCLSGRHGNSTVRMNFFC